MKKTTLLISLAAVLVILACVGWISLVVYWVKSDFALSRHSENVTGYHVHFGIIEMNSSSGDVLSKETSVIPLRLKDSGFRYGIEITPPNDESYTYHCVFHLSAVPKIVEGDSFAGQAPSATLQTNESSDCTGTIVDENWFDEGDPLGEQSVDVFINNKLATTIKYTVVSEK